MNILAKTRQFYPFCPTFYQSYVTGKKNHSLGLSHRTLILFSDPSPLFSYVIFQFQ